MSKRFQIPTRIAMALVLSLGLIIPGLAGWLTTPTVPSELCGHCLLDENQAPVEPVCCSETEQQTGQPEAPSTDQDCRCPGCPIRTAQTPIVFALFPSALPLLPPTGVPVFSPDFGPKNEQLNEAPPSPPPRLG